MSDLISRSALLKSIWEVSTSPLNEWDTIGVLNIVNKQPTVEAKEVVHGEWIYNEYYTWECGNCGFHPFKGFIPKEPGFNYCPNCGCDMREGNDVE